MKSTSKLFISEQSQWDRCRLKMRVAAMKIPSLIAAILLSVTSFLAQAEPVPPNAGRVHAILGQWHGSSYTQGEFGVVKIYGVSHWRQFWREYIRRKEPGDFDESLHQAVYIQLGVRPTGGYAVKVVRAYEEGNQLVLEYVKREPTPDQYVTQALTTPWVMVLLARTDLRVVTRKSSAAWAE